MQMEQCALWQTELAVNGSTVSTVKMVQVSRDASGRQRHFSETVQGRTALYDDGRVILLLENMIRYGRKSE